MVLATLAIESNSKCRPCDLT